MAGKQQKAASESNVKADDAGTVIDTTTINDGVAAGTAIDTTTVNDGVAAGTDIDTTTVNDGVAADTVIDTTTISNAPGTISVSGDVTVADGSGTVVPEVEMDNTRRPVVFLGPHHRYSRGDTACFDSEYAQELVARRIAVWPEDAKRALNPRKGDDDHETDIG